jgi:hypothetical protein
MRTNIMKLPRWMATQERSAVLIGKGFRISGKGEDVSKDRLALPRGRQTVFESVLRESSEQVLASHFRIGDFLVEGAKTVGAA